MTFSTFENSRASGAPINLYRFVYGTGLSINVTDADVATTIDAVTYEPAPITAGAINAKGNLDKAQLKIEIDAVSTYGQSLGDLFLVFPPSQEVSLTIRNGHVGDTDFPVKWAGRVLSCAWEGSKAELSCEPVSTSLRRPGLRRRYSLGCVYALYDVETCKASEAAATVSTTVSSISGTVVTVPSGWNGAVAAAKFNGGIARWTTGDGRAEIRRILAATTTTVRLSGLLTTLNASDAIDFALGCNRQESDCTTLHSNIENFGGQPWLPLKNPFGFYNNFY